MDLNLAVTQIDIHRVLVHEVSVRCPVVLHLDDGDVLAEAVQIDGALTADQTAAQNDNLLSDCRLRLMQGIQTDNLAAVNTRNRRDNRLGTDAVFGCGTVGMSAIMAAKIAGCKNIIAVGGNPKSLELAKELGATHTINRREESDIVGKIKNEIVPGGVNYAIDTSGVADFVKKALASCRFMGTAVVLGATGDVTFNIQAELMGDAKSLIGITEGDAIPKLFIPELLDYYKKGMFPFDKLIKFYPFEKINEAFEESGSGKCIKAVLRMDQ